MKILTIDIETSPNLGWFFSLWNQNMSLNQVEEFTEVISFAAKWHGSKKVLFYSTFHDGKEAMVQAAFDLLSEADVVVGYNSKGFDLKHLNREFFLADLGAPEPYAQVDLMLEVKKNFRFASNKLDHVIQQLGIGKKTSTGGFDLWLGCLHGERKAWNLMRKYNKHDVVVTEQLYDKMLPWIKSHPAHGLYTPSLLATCTNCGSDRLQKRGFAKTNLSTFQQYRCTDCGKWLRSGKRVDNIDLRGI